MSLLDNLISYWKLDESSGNASDETANNNDLTNQNSVAYSAAKINNGADFVSANSKYLTKVSAANLPLGASARTFSLWFKSPDAGSLVNYTFLMYGTGSSKALQWFAFGNDGGGNRGVAWNGYASDLFRAYAFAANTWYHIVGTFDGTNARVYINGSLQGSAEDHSDWNTSGATLSLGRSEQSGGTYYLNGSLDEVGIWSRALSSDDVLELYNSGDGLQYPFSVAPSFSRAPTMLNVF